MMRRISLSLLAATAMGVIACQGASAADMAVKAAPPPPPPPPLWNWTGLYVGGVFGLGSYRRGRPAETFATRSSQRYSLSFGSSGLLTLTR